MTIEYGAFLNCISLSCIHFKNITLPVFTNISYANNLPRNFRLVVPDNILLAELSSELVLNKDHVFSETENKILNVVSSKKQLDLYLAITALSAILELTICKELIKHMIGKYDIDIDKLNVFKEFLKI